MTRAELLAFAEELVRHMNSTSMFEPQALQFLTVRGLTLEEARACLALATEVGVLERTMDSHYRAR